MISLLIGLALSQATLHAVNPNHPAIYDLEYHPNDGKPNKRFSKTGLIMMARYNGLLYDFWDNNRGKYRTEPEFDIKLTGWPSNNDNNEIVYTATITNKLDNPLEIDLGAFAAFSNTALSWAKGNSTIKAVSNDGMKTMAVVKGADYNFVKYHEPATIFFGKYNIPQNGINVWNLPYFENTQEEVSDATNNAYAFSWHEVIPAKGTGEIRFLIISKDDIVRPPFIYIDRPNNFDQYPTNFTLSFKVVSYDAGTIGVKTEGCKYLVDQPEPFYSDGDKSISRTYKLRGYYEQTDHDPFTCQLKATTTVNVNNGESWDIPYTFYKAGRAKPKMTFSQETSGNLQIGDPIIIRGEVFDEQQVTLKYKIGDNGAEHTYTTIVTAPSGKASFSVTLPTTNLPVGPNIVYLWPEDPLGNKPENIDRLHWSLTMVLPDVPRLADLSISKIRAHPGDQVIIVGKGSGPEADVSVSAHWRAQDGPEQYLDTFKAGNSVKLLGFYYNIPMNAPTGLNTIHLKAVGKGGATSWTSINVYVAQVNPAQKTISTISDISSELKSMKSCFNLQYNINGGGTTSMSHNNEGFYVAYRAYVNELYPGNTHYVTKEDNYQSTEDNITVKYFSMTEPKTGYFQAMFNVTNNENFDKSIDLGIFVDSDFGQRDQQIQLRPDGTGIVISDEASNLYYTVFTTFGDYPSASHINIAPNIKRPAGNSELDYSSMTFFENSQTEFYVGDDPMYSISWNKKLIPAQQTVTFVLTFAGYDDVRTPSRITREISPNLAKYEPNSQFNLTFTIDDDNLGEMVEYNIKLPNAQPEIQEFKVGEEPKVIPKHSLNTGAGPVYEYTITVKDKVTGFPSVLTEKLQVHRDFTFNVHGSDDVIKSEYLADQEIKLEGDIVGADNEEIIIKYQFGQNAKVEEIKTTSKHVKTTIPIPAYVYPRKDPWQLIVWAETKNGFVQTNNKFSKTIAISTKDNPVLRYAGFATKRAYKGQRIIAFAAVNDVNYGRYLDIYVKFGHDGKFQQIPQDGARLHYYKPINKPFAFYYTVPETAKEGKVYEVSFMAVDSTGLQSEQHSTTLVITPHVN